MFLSRLSPSMLEREAHIVVFPKWNTLCLLRLLKLPALDAAFISSGTANMKATIVVEQFASILGSDHLLVRSDGGRESGQYYRGGNTLPIDRAVETVHALLKLNRAVILLEPTNRFTNQLAVNFLAVNDGTFVIEVLGPGYDLADLNRVGTPAHYVIYGRLDNWSEFKSLSSSDIEVVPSQIDEKIRRQARLSDIGTKILPGMGIDVTGPPNSFAEAWLRENGYDDLWYPWGFDLTLHQLQTWYEDAFIVANFIERYRQWTALVLSWSMLHDYRCVYWDVVDANAKFAL